MTWNKSAVVSMYKDHCRSPSITAARAVHTLTVACMHACIRHGALLVRTDRDSWPVLLPSRTELSITLSVCHSTGCEHMSNTMRTVASCHQTLHRMMHILEPCWQPPPEGTMTLVTVVTCLTGMSGTMVGGASMCGRAGGFSRCQSVLPSISFLLPSSPSALEHRQSSCQSPE